MNRRYFVKQAGMTAGALVFARGLNARSTQRNDQIVLAVVGIRGQGRSHLIDFSRIQGVRVKTICEVDERLFPDASVLAREITGEDIHLEVDIRRVLDDEEIDAISIATPNHWHSLVSVWACQAGKDV